MTDSNEKDNDRRIISLLMENAPGLSQELLDFSLNGGITSSLLQLLQLMIILYQD